MRHPSAGRDGDLVLVAALALAALPVAVLPSPDWLRAVVLLPTALLAPGYALLAALLPPGFVSRDERVVLTVALSIAAWALGGLLLQVFVELDRTLWIALLLFLTLPAAIVARLRRQADGNSFRVPSPPPLPGARAVASLLAAAAVGAAALAVGSAGAERQLERSRFSELWMVAPGPGLARPGDAVRVGVRNREGRRLAYRVRLSRAGVTAGEWEIRLADEAAWSVEATVPGGPRGRPLVATLSLHGSLHRRVALDVEAR